MNLLDQCRLEYSDLIEKRRLALEHTNFVNIPALDLKKSFNRKITVRKHFDIGLVDLGFSNFQLMDQDRGFSYLPENKDSILDMRFDTSTESNYVTASDILNGSSEYELTQIFKKFGEEPFASLLAQKVIKAREGTILATSEDFKNAIF